MKVKKLLALVLALIMVFALFAGCGPKDPVVEESPSQPPAGDPSPEVPPTEELGEPIKIGHIVDRTGVESSTGDVAIKSLEFAVKYIGGKIGNRPIEIIVEDAQSDSSIAADVARKLVEQDKVDIIFGPTQVGHKGTVATYLEEAGVPAVYYNATSPFLLNQNNPWIIAAGGANNQMPTVMAAYLFNELGYTKVNTMAQDNQGGRSYINPFKEAFEALGGEVVDEIYAPEASNDFTTQLASMKKDVDAIVAWFSGGTAIALWTQWYESGLYESVPMVGTMHGGFTDYFVGNALAGKDPSGKMVQAMLDSAVVPIFYSVGTDTPENKAFVEAWQAEYDEYPLGSNLPGACCQAILLLQAAVEATGGDTTPETLRDALLAADVKGPEGHTYFKDSQAATKDVFIVKPVQLEDGTFNYETITVYEDVPPSGYVVE